MALIEIDGLPMKHGDFPWRTGELLNNQMGSSWHSLSSEDRNLLVKDIGVNAYDIITVQVYDKDDRVYRVITGSH